MRPRLALTAAQLRATEARELALREQRVDPPSTSVTPVRCAHCGHWCARTAWVCGACGIRRES